jgi:imidazolonepropionase-like amidohydrolase
MLVKCGTLIDGTGREPRPGALVEVRDDRIVGVGGPGPSAPRDTVDWSGYTVLPGLIDAHDHLTLDLGDEEAQSRMPEAWTVLQGAGNAARILAAGITTLRDCGARRHLDVQLKKAIAGGLIRGPRLLVSGVPLTVTGGQCWFLGGEVDSADEIRRIVRQQAKAGADWIKVFVTGGVATRGTNMLRAAFSAADLRVLVEEAHEADRLVVAHCHGGPGTRHAIEAGVDTLEHGVYVTREDLEQLAARRIPLVITYGVYERGAKSTDVPPFFRDKCVEVMARYLETIRTAREVGVRIAVGTDTVHRDLAAELRALEQAGYSAAEAVQAATRWGAEALRLPSVGTVEAGKSADLVAVEGNPYEDLAAFGRVRGVMQDGELVASP